MTKKILCCAIIALQAAVSNGQGNSIIPMDPSLKYGILENGLTYYIKSNKKTKERADFYIVQNVGAILEEDHQDGLAHFLEHMAFNGTKNFPDKQLINYFETVGVKFGANINAYTSLDETVYNLKDVPTYRESIIDSALLVLHDWSSNITLLESEIDKERGVIREEWRTRNSADRRLWGESLPLLYPNSQYAKRDIIGDTAVINNFKPEDIRSFYKKWYRPDLQAIIVVGDINADSTEAKVKALFSKIPKAENAAVRPYYTIENNENPIVVVLSDPECKYTRMRIDYRRDPLGDREKASEMGYFFSVCTSLIEKMMNDRFSEIEQQPNSPIIGAGAYYREMVKTKDAFTLSVAPNDGKEYEALATILTEAKRVNDHGFTQSELDRAKTDLMSTIEKAFNERNKTSNASFVNEYKSNFLDFSPVPGIEWEFNFIKTALPFINLETINGLAKSFIGEKNIDIVITGPQNEKTKLPSEKDAIAIIDSIKASATAAYIDNTVNEPLIEKLPKKGKIKKEINHTDKGYKEWKLSNGATVFIKNTNFKDDEILFYAYANGGLSTVEDINDLPSAMISTEIVANCGIGKFDNIQLNKILAGKNISLSSDITENNESLSGKSTVKDIETLLQLIHLNFTAIRKDSNAFNSLINQYRTILTNADADPNKAFSDSILATTYAQNDRIFSFSSKHLNMVKEETAHNFFKERFSNPADFTFFFIGNINETTLKALVEKYIASIKKGKGRKNWKDNNIRIAKGAKENYFTKEQKVEKSSNYVLYSADMEFNTKNRLNVSVIKDILRLRYTETLREEEGGTYGVSTTGYINKLPINQAILKMTFDTDPKLRDKLMGILHNEVIKLMTDGPTEKDLNKVKENMLKNYNESQTENNWWLNIMISEHKDGYTYFDDFEKNVGMITAESVKETLRSIISQDNEISVSMSSTSK